MAVTAGVALPDKVLNFCFGQLGRDVFMKHRFDFLLGDYVSVALVEHAEALLRLFVSSRLVLAVPNHVLAKCEIYTVPLFEVRVTLSEFFIDLTRVHFMESEVLQYVCKVASRDKTGLVAIVKVECFLEIGDHVAGQVVDV